MGGINDLLLALVLTGAVSLLSVLAYLFLRNESEHKEINEKVGDIIVNQAEMKKDIHHLDERLDRIEMKLDKLTGDGHG